MDIKNMVQQGARPFGVLLSEQALEQFCKYGDLLLEWNEKINLTAIKQPEEIAVKHFVDSLTLLSVINLQPGARIIDVGTGAGFPGVPIKIARPDVHLTLLDSLNKRLLFLQELIKALQLDAEFHHLRAEEGGRKPELREAFDFVTSRAVANLNVLAEYCIPYVKVGGFFAAMKGPEVEQEWKAASHAVELLGAKLVQQKQFTLPDGSGRAILLMEKVKKTPSQYPRHGGTIAKKPLQ